MNFVGMPGFVHEALVGLGTPEWAEWVAYRPTGRPIWQGGDIIRLRVKRVPERFVDIDLGKLADLISASPIDRMKIAINELDDEFNPMAPDDDFDDVDEPWMCACFCNGLWAADQPEFQASLHPPPAPVVINTFHSALVDMISALSHKHTP